jgi:MFS family permease
LDKFGRKKTIIVGGFFHFMSLFLISFCYGTGLYSLFPYALYLFAFGQAIGFNLFFILLPKILEHYAIDIAYNASLIAILSPPLFVYLKSNGLQFQYIFVGFYVIGIWIFFIKNIHEKKGKTRDEIMRDNNEQLPSEEKLMKKNLGWDAVVKRGAANAKKENEPCGQ